MAQPGAPRLGDIAATGQEAASALAELKACTPASLSPSNGVTGLLARQAEVIVRRVGEPDADPVEVDAHARGRRRAWTRRPPGRSDLKVFWPLPCALVLKSPMYSAAPNGAPACSSKKTVKSRLGGRFLAWIWKLSKPALFGGELHRDVQRGVGHTLRRVAQRTASAPASRRRQGAPRRSLRPAAVLRPLRPG